MPLKYPARNCAKIRRANEKKLYLESKFQLAPFFFQIYKPVVIAQFEAISFSVLEI